MLSGKAMFSRSKSLNFQSPSFFAPAFGAGILIFAAVFFYGGDGVWTEAWLAAMIFALAAKSFGNGGFILDRDFLKLVAPILALAAFSFLQGALTLYALVADFENRLAVFYSFDPAASLWCAAKFFALVVFMILMRAKFRESIKPLVWTLVIIGNFFAAFGLLRLFLQTSAPDFFAWFPLPALRPNVGFGTFINQNHFAFLMLMNLGLNGGLLLLGKLSKALKLLLAAATFICWTAIVLTASRGGIISSCFVIMALVLSFLIIKLKKKGAARESMCFGRKFNLSFLKSAAAIVALIAALVFGIALVGRERVAQRFEEIPLELSGATDGAGFTRLDVWRASERIIREHPLTGIGFGGFRRAVSGFIDISGGTVPEAAHNDYLDFIASGGALALLIAIWMAVVFFRTLKRRLIENLNVFERAARAGIIAALIGIAVHSFFDYGLQYAGNWLSFAALIVVILRGENPVKSPDNDGDFIRIKEKKRFVFAAIFTALALSCIWFGSARYSNFVVRAGNEDKLYFAPAIFKIPLDADYYETLSAVDERAGNYPAAAENLRRAIRLRPEDFVLRLKVAAAAERAGNFIEAENELRQATRLAPLYGEPHFALGEFLLRRDRAVEAATELRYAATRRPAYFSQILEAFWTISDGDPMRLWNLLEPLNDVETDDFVEFLYEKNRFIAIGDLLCAAENFDGGRRDKVIQKLFEKRQFSIAARIFRHDCKMQYEASSLLIDGDFETAELRENLGFGWRVGDVPETLRIGFADDVTASGENSLAVIFGGNADSSLPLVSQVLPVEKNRRYQISFASRTEKITSAGLPVVNFILKKQDADAPAGEIDLTVGKEAEWTRRNIVVKTDASTEAIEIRLTRKTCAENFCPIFGRLWLDDFRIRPID